MSHKIENIVLHCSDSEYGTAVTIDQWHRARGWQKIGYMGVILNGYPEQGIYWEQSDGAWEWGRPLNQNPYIESWELESHALGINHKSVGICLIGKTKFTRRQFLRARIQILSLCSLWSIPHSSVIGHYEVKGSGKSCPNIDMNLFRAFLKDDKLINSLTLTEDKKHG